MKRQLARLYMKFAIGAVVLTTPAVVQATPIFTNFAPGFSYDTTTGNPVGNGLDFTGFNYAEGDTFVPVTNASLGSIRIALSYFTLPLAAVIVSVTRDAGDQPGAVLEAFVVPPGSLGALGSNNPPIFENSLLHPLLIAGTRYWITVSAPFIDSIAWNLNTVGDTADHALSIDGGATWFSPSGLTPGAFEVDPLVAEPGTIWLMTSGVLVFLSGRQICRLGKREGRRRCGANLQRPAPQ